MKILYLTPGVFDKGGISRYGRFQIDALREVYGRESVAVISLMGRQDGDLELPLDVLFAGAMPLSRASRALFSVVAFREAIRFRPDIILCGHVNLGPLAYVLARTARAVFVQNIYGREIWGGQMTRSRRHTLRNADLVIADCHNTAARTLELGLVHRAPEVVWDCVSTDRYTPAQPSWPTLEEYSMEKRDRFRILFLGRVTGATRYKGFDRLLQLVAALPAGRFEAIIAGKGDALDDVARLSVELGVADRTTITGAIHEAHMPDIYRAADAFYLVSEVGHGMGEGIPLTPMEAMACGVPVLVGSQDGSRELLATHGGWCGEPQDLAGQAAYLLALDSDPALLARERQAARERSVTAFGYERFAAETIAAVEAVVVRGIASDNA